MNPTPPNAWGRIRAVLRYGPFNRYLAGEAISMTGTWMQSMAQSWVMTTLTDRAILLGWVNFAMGIPMVFLTLYGGVLADRFDKRRILLLAQVIQIILALMLGWLVAQERIQIWHLIAVALLLGTTGSFEMPAAAALVPELVGKECLSTAIAMERATFHGTRLVGPAMAGYAVAQWGSSSAFYLNALSFAAFILALLTLPKRMEGTPEEEARRRSGMKEGFDHVRSDRPTLAMIAVMVATTVLIFPVLVVMLPLYARNVLLLGADKMGLLMGISGVGALTGSLGLMALGHSQRIHFLFSAVCGASCGLVGLGISMHFYQAAISLAMTSLSVSTLIGLANIIVQERAPGPLRGRVSSVAALSFFGLMPFAGLFVTAIADMISIRYTLLVSALAYSLITISLLLANKHQLKGVSSAAHVDSPP